MKRSRLAEGPPGKPTAPAPASVLSSDPRFKAVHSDPRFARFPKAQARVEIDERFKGVFDDPKFRRRAVVDKRGRKTVERESKDDMRRFYRLPEPQAAEEDDEEDEVDAHAEAGVEEAEEEEEAAAERAGRMRGLRGSVSLSSSESDEEEEKSQSEEEGVIAAFVAGEEEATDTIDETYRLAVVDLEWERIRAVDILAVLRSFLPSGGAIVRVSVYPSDFGLERMKEEEMYGPRGAFSDPTAEEDMKDGVEVDVEKLRKYERERLRYCYAIVECDSPATAASLYQQCDGLEFERSSTRFDLRYVPDEQQFNGRVLRDAATHVPPSYTPVDYTSKALQQTRVGLSWDADDPDRKKQLRRKITPEQLKEEDFAAYLGSGSEDDLDDADAQKGEAARLRALILGSAAAAAPASEDDGDEDEEAVKRSDFRAAATGGDMIVTFGGGLEERLLAKRAAAAGAPPATVWEEHLRNRRAKKLAAKQAQTLPPPADDPGFDDPFFSVGGGGAAAWEAEGEQDDEEKPRAKPRKKLARKAAAAAPVDDPAAARRRAELELLVMNDAQLREGLAHRPAPAASAAVRLSRKEARHAARTAKLAAREEDAELGVAAEVDVADPRFDALFTRPEFALDPTDPRFKSLKGVDAIRKEAALRRASGRSSAPAAALWDEPAVAGSSFSSLVKRLKKRGGA